MLRLIRESDVNKNMTRNPQRLDNTILLGKLLHFQTSVIRGEGLILWGA